MQKKNKKKKEIEMLNEKECKRLETALHTSKKRGGNRSKSSIPTGGNRGRFKGGKRFTRQSCKTLTGKGIQFKYCNKLQKNR